MNPRARAFLSSFCAALGLFAGCTVGPKYQRATAPVPAHWDVAAPWRESAPKDALPKGEWWAAFADDELRVELPAPLVSRVHARHARVAS